MRRALVVLVLGIVGFAAAGCAAGAEPAPAPVAAAPLPAVSPAPAADPGHAPLRVRIPGIGVDSAVVGIGVDGTGALVPPDSTAVTGWFTAGPAPGDAGPALLAAHVDSKAGPGVFFRLRDLRSGDLVEVVRRDGSTVAFTVDGQSRAAKTAFPTDLVYAPTPGPELRLVTCGGAFDRKAGSYLDNVIVDAVPAGESGWTLG
ncbi:hypothetical protein GCM10009836_03430 [Pseudonocardia ailaonensis]|uniref:Class F sortase n=1 Tax=Pseudonocardia ailaonensis TaxID=367279 RepID=A0ABN2MKC7_9PSEU